MSSIHAGLSVMGLTAKIAATPGTSLVRLPDGELKGTPVFELIKTKRARNRFR